MLTQEEFEQWCDRLNLSDITRTVIQQVRSSDPSRRVGSGRGNVAGIYPSLKMGVTIQFEAHRTELARIYEFERDPDVLEYYDQPPPIELSYLSKSGRMLRHLYTPDFFIIRKNFVGWEECKPENDLVKLSERNSNRYRKDEGGIWHCPPGEAYAERFGLQFWVWSSASISWTFQQNFIWLADYFGLGCHALQKNAVQEILSLVQTKIGITLAELLQSIEVATVDDIYTLIAAEEIYVNLNTVRLSDSHLVQVFLNEEVAIALERTVQTVPLSIASNLAIIKIEVGASLSWDGEFWEVVNTGASTTGILRDDGKFVDLPNTALNELIQKGRVVTSDSLELPNGKQEIEAILSRARPDDIREANRRYKIIEPYLAENPPAGITRNLRRWRNLYRQAEKLYGNGYIGLLPKNNLKGNREPKLDATVQQCMVQFIENHYENHRQRGKLRVYEAFQVACETHEPKLISPSFNRFCLEIHRRSGYNQTLKREGKRAAIQKEVFYWQLEQTTPRHGDRPFEIVHIDHTPLDIELLTSLASLSNLKLDVLETSTHNLGSPWATYMVDAYSRRLLAVYLTYEEPSYRTCMMVLRICVIQFRRMPQTIVVDNGPEFDSIYFDRLMARYCCTKKHRPPATPRFGSVQERLFGTTHTQFIYELEGNTQIRRKHRQVTKSVDPKNHAKWTLSDLYEALYIWAYQIYDKRQHPSLGQSPCQAFDTGIALGGSRNHIRIEYDDEFRILTLPAPKKDKRKVQPGRGVKIHNIYYWSNEFRNPEIEKSPLEVRYDPFDMGIAYALVKGQWVKCISDYYQYLQGRSEKEIRLISAEIYERKRQHNNSSILSDRELVQFLNTLEAKEGDLLKQQLRASENRIVLQLIEGGVSKQNSSNTHQIRTIDLDEISEEVDIPEVDIPKEAQEFNHTEESEPEILEYYGQF